MKKVRTFNGVISTRDKCRKIKGQYYIENEQCFLMPDGKWHRIDNGLISFDHETSKYVFVKNTNLTLGIVGKNQDGTPKFGNFTQNVAKNVTFFDGSKYQKCLTRSIAENLDAQELIGDGVFYNQIPDRYRTDNKYRIFKNYSIPLSYRCGYRLDEITNHFNQNFVGDELKHSFYKHLPDVTFGIEYETYDGRIPEDLMVKNGLIPVKDGSLRRDGGYNPFEYATIILSGKRGIQAIKKQCELLQKYCSLGIDGSLHVHVGNKNRSKEYVSSLYMLISYIQDEIYELFPLLFKQTSLFKQTGTDYCKPIVKKRYKKNADEYNFDIISKEICGVDGWKFNKFGEGHPLDPEETRKWDVKSRYKIVNLIPTIFGKSGTAEFRIHSSTFNYDKIINWIFIISAIVKYATDNRYKIINDHNICKNINLETIIKEVYKDSQMLTSYLIEYVKYRKNLMLEHQRQGDKIGELDVTNDNLDSFEFPIKSLVL